MLDHERAPADLPEGDAARQGRDVLDLGAGEPDRSRVASRSAGLWARMIRVSESDSRPSAIFASREPASPAAARSERRWITSMLATP